MATLSMEFEDGVTDFRGSLQLDKSEVNVQECVNVYWDFSSSAYVPNSRDFIGLFEAGKYVHVYIFCSVAIWQEISHGVTIQIRSRSR